MLTNPRRLSSTCWPDAKALRNAALKALGPELAKDAATLHALACTQGMHTLYEDGLHKVADGTTSLDELLRVTQDNSDA